MINRNTYILLNGTDLTYQSNRDNKEIIVDTTTNSYTVVLPNNPILGSTLTVVDATGNSSTNNITIQSNHQLINGNPTFTLDVDYGAVRFIYDTLNNDQIGIIASGGGLSTVATDNVTIGGDGITPLFVINPLPKPIVNNGSILGNDGINWIETNDINVSASGIKLNKAIHYTNTLQVTTNGQTIGTEDTVIFVDTTTIPITINLPSSPELGRIISIKDIAGTSTTNPITVNGNGALIDGSGSFVIAQAFESYTFYFQSYTMNWMLI